MSLSKIHWEDMTNAIRKSRHFDKKDGKTYKKSLPSVQSGRRLFWNQIFLTGNARRAPVSICAPKLKDGAFSKS